MRNLIQQALDPLWGAVINTHEFGLLDNTLRLGLTVTENGVTRTHVLSFSGVSAVYYSLADGPARFMYAKAAADHLELLAAEYVENGIGTVRMWEHTAPWNGEFPTRPTFGLAIWEAWLFVEASCVSVDDKTFVIEQPTRL